MIRTCRCWAWLIAVVLGVVPVWAQPAAKAPKAKLSLVPFAEGVVPDGPFEVGVRFALEEEWHLYWKNSGDAGLPPRIKWQLPPGFSASEPRFPVPRRLYSPGDIVTNVLEGEPVLLVTVTPPPTIPSDKVTLSAEVVYLVCAEQCIREEAKISAELPVQPAGSEVTRANESIFKRAQRALPAIDSKHLEVKPVVLPPALQPGGDFELKLSVSIKPGLHIQSHKPALPSLIPAEVFLEKIDGVSFKPAAYPKPKTREVPYLGTLTEYEGRLDIQIAGSVAADAASAPGSIDGVFAYQACNDQGNCFPPEGVAFSAKVAAGVQKGDAAPVGTPPDEPANAAPAPGAEGQAEPAAATGGFDDFFRRFGLIGLLAACFGYGLFINATPCVLPLLSIKVLGFVQQAHQSRRRTAMLGLSFGVGVVVFFVILGLLASSGKNILMYPVAVIALGGIILALSLSMLGVYTLQVPTAATSLEARIHSEGVVASFGKGALAPVLGFACTGPLLAGAWGWAVKQPPNVAILAFVFAGLGMASPYMLLGANPRWLSFLPRPGNWMITFERVMGFLLLAMVVWMIHPLSQQIGVAGLEWTLVFYIVIAFGCWLLGKVTVTMSDLQRWRYRGFAGALIAASGVFIYGWVLRPVAEINWQPWSAAVVEATVRSGKPAFVDFTAAYCTVCKVNKIRAINTDEVRAKLDQCGTVPFQGDYTSGDPEIGDLLAKYDRAGVPLNLIYPPGRPDSPIVLTPDLSREYLLEKLDEVACAKPVAASILGSRP